EGGIDLFFERLEPVLEKITKDYEIICIDDGSTDATLDELLEHRERNPRIKIINLSRNFGKDVALSAGLDYATGQAVVPLDADLQDPPELIAEMMDKWREGYEVVYARRSDRKSDSVSKRVTAGWFYRVHNAIADVSIPDNVGDFRLIDQRVNIALQNLPERTRFMKGLFAWVGFKQASVEYVRESRAYGDTKWHFWKLWQFALDGITGSTTFPLRVWTYIGMLVSLTAFIVSTLLIIRVFIYGVDVPGYASLMVAVLFLGGINILATGIIGEYIGRIFTEVRHRPLYLVRDTYGLEK
ncbi:MAG: glycosyltransferase family 2 protein, partial [Hyphomicrobiales bacterium]|nr:glycosyltransferase family 2 protein [Hyphomicrobiales bacterium]